MLHRFRRLARATALLAALAVVTGVALAPAGASFSDVDPNDPFADEIAYVSDHGIMTGFHNGTFRPARLVSRGAMAAFLYRQAGSPEFAPPVSADRSFVDVPASHPQYAAIEWAAAEGIATGWPTDYIDPETGPLPEYRPSRAITRQSVAVDLYRAAGSPAHHIESLPGFEDVPSAALGAEHPFRRPIEWARHEQLMLGWHAVPPGGICADYGCWGWFRPRAPISRGAMAAVLSRFDQQFPASSS